MTVSPLALVTTWGQLVEAYWGKANYGGGTAEIYAYTLMPYSPMAHTHAHQREKILVAMQAANALCSIVEEFCSQYDCEAQVDGLPLDEWRYHINHNESGFDHRCHVHIIKKGIVL